MRILVFEFITGGGMANESISPSLLREGDLMLHALLSDLNELAGVELVTTRDHRLDPPTTQVKVYYLNSEEDFRDVWVSLLQEVDAVWPIAPESHGILEHLSIEVVENGKTLLNSRPAAVRIAASKKDITQIFRNHGIPVVPTYSLNGVPLGKAEKWVIKPNDGVGCEGIKLCDGIEFHHDTVHGQRDGRKYIAQPYTEGVPTSLSILCRDGEACLLSSNYQRIALVDDGFRLQACVVGAIRDKRESYQELTSEIAAALPSLWGYVGVDLIETAAGPRVLDVNPRLTTSYAGLRHCLATNPAALVLDLLDVEKSLPASPSITHSVRIDLEDACVV